VTCRELVAFLVDYLEGTLPAERRAAFEEHLRLCPGCTEYLDSYQATVRLTRDAFCGADPESEPPAIPEQLVQAILAARKKDAP
jgi:anti-sigma factor RsiW